MTELTLKAPAKINLRLKVLGRRTDGYHEIETIMQRISLSDILRLRPLPRGAEIICPGCRELEGEHNLALQALHRLSEELHRPLPFQICLWKRIPWGAGLGGGSSDAAAVLKGINGFLGEPVAPARLFELAARLGSDVPFFLLEQTALARGRGERLDPLPGFPAWWVVLVNPGFPLATSWVYQQLKINLTKKIKSDNFRSLKNIKDLRPRDFLENDLEGAVFPHYPVLADIKEALHRLGSSGSLMTGSGSTVFGLWEEKKAASRAVRALRSEGWGQVILTRGLP